MIDKKLSVITSIFLLCLLWSSASAATPTRVLVLGDSLSAAYGIDPKDGWVALLRDRLAEDQYTVTNASISGETTAGGLSRLPPLLEKHRPNLLVLELGANDGLRGLSISAMQRNLRQIIDQTLAADGQVLVLGMLIPPNYGPTYTRAFAGVFTELAKLEKVTLVPFFLQDVATDYNLVQADGLHPTAAAQPKLLDNIFPGFSLALENLELESAQ